MKNFLYKELKLCVSPLNYIFLLFATMILIPNYPYYVPFFYICLAVFFIFNNSQLDKDLAYSMILPITKKDMVKSRCIIVFVYEIVALVLTIPFAVIKVKAIQMENIAGIEPNVAFYGFSLIIYTFFHYILFTKFYKKAEKPAIAFIFATVAYWITFFIVEFPIWTKDVFGVEYFKVLDRVDFASQMKQLPILVTGIIIYIAGWILTYRKSAESFEKVDL